MVYPVIKDASTGIYTPPVLIIGVRTSPEPPSVRVSVVLVAAGVCRDGGDSDWGRRDRNRDHCDDQQQHCQYPMYPNFW